MILIIEGLDGTGKTTFAKKFSEIYNFTYIKESYTNNCKEKEKRVHNLIERLEENKNYIYDRTTLIDDFVYSFLNKQESSLKFLKKRIFFLLSQCEIVHLVIDEDIRKKRMQERGDEYITEDDIKKISKNYFDFYQELLSANKKDVKFFQITENTEEDVKILMEVIKNDKNITHCIK